MTIKHGADAGSQSVGSSVHVPMVLRALVLLHAVSAGVLAKIGGCQNLAQYRTEAVVQDWDAGKVGGLWCDLLRVYPKFGLAGRLISDSDPHQV